MSRRARRTLGIFACVVLAALAAAGAAGAAGRLLVPQPGPLNPAFVESLHDPLAGAFGRRPAPVITRIGAAERARLDARAARLVPATFDLRTEGRIPPVRNQGKYGTCWAFANIAGVESRLLPAENWDFSEDNLITRSGYGPFSGGAYEWGGWDFMAVAYLTRWDGPVNETDDPYGTFTPPATNIVRKHVQGVVMLPGRTGALDNDLLKQMVMQNGALSVGMFYDTAFYSDAVASTDATGTATYYCDLTAGDTYRGYEVGENHGVDIIGWDDAFPRTRFAAAAGRPPGDGAFLVRNSWGARFGEGGYFWVSYYDRSFAFGPCTSYARVDDTTDYRHNYQYDTLGWTTSWGFPDAADPSVAWGANRFTATGPDPIVAVGFYAPVAGTGYQVWAGQSLAALTMRGSGTSALPGFITVGLDTPLTVRRGRHFVVAVRLATPGSTQPIAVERPVEMWESHAVARPGQSYMRAGDTDRWYDLTRNGANPNANVCLKAYAGP